MFSTTISHFTSMQIKARRTKTLVNKSKSVGPLQVQHTSVGSAASFILLLSSLGFLCARLGGVTSACHCSSRCNYLLLNNLRSRCLCSGCNFHSSSCLRREIKLTLLRVSNHRCCLWQRLLLKLLHLLHWHLVLLLLLNKLHLLLRLLDDLLLNLWLSCGREIEWVPM